MSFEQHFGHRNIISVHLEHFITSKSDFGAKTSAKETCTSLGIFGDQNLFPKDKMLQMNGNNVSMSKMLLKTHYFELGKDSVVFCFIIFDQKEAI